MSDPAIEAAALAAAARIVPLLFKGRTGHGGKAGGEPGKRVMTREELTAVIAAAWEAGFERGLEASS